MELILALFLVWIIWGRRLRRLQTVVADLQKQVAEIYERAKGPETTEAEPQQPAVSPGVSPEPAPEPAVAPPAQEAAAPPPEPGPKVAEAPPQAPAAPSPIPTVPLVAHTGEVAVREPVHEPKWTPLEPPLVQRAFQRVSAFLKEREFAEADWEALIGGRWLNKIGIAVLVIGVALFLGYSLQYMGPPGKVATGLVTSLTLLLGGVYLERVERYSLFAKPLIGGGWALLYFTAYAAHNIDAAKIIEEPNWALFLLGIVAAGMILHSLKYRSEVVTGLAYALAFLTVAISPLTSFSLIATSLLAVSLLAILRAIPWYRLGPLGIAGTYLNHLLWLQSPIGEVAGVGPAQLFWVSQGMLVLYWLLFTGFAFVRKPETDRQEWLSLAVNAANTLSFLGLSLWQVQDLFPDQLYVLTGAAGIAYGVTGSLLRLSGRHNHHLVDGSVAVTLLAATFPLALRTLPLSVDWLAVAWLAQAGVVLAVGFRLREIVFRVEAYLLSLAVFGALYAFNLPGLPAGRHLILWLTTVPAIAYFYFLFEQLRRRAGREDVRTAAREVGVVCGYAATALLATLLWQELRPELVGLAWLGAGLVLFEVGSRFPRLHLRLQGYILSALALGAVFLINLYGLYGLPQVDALSRWVAVPPAILAFYYLFWRLQRVASIGMLDENERENIDLPSYAATALLTVLLWKEFDAVAVAVVWGFLGLLLYEAGGRFNEISLRIQGHLLAIFAFGRLFLANFIASGEMFGLSSRLVTVVPILALLYYLGYSVREAQARGEAATFERYLPQVYSYAAALGLVLLARFELGRAYTVIAWAGLALIFFALGVMWRGRDFRLQGYLIAAAAFWRSWGTNFYLMGSYYGLPERIATTVPVLVCLFAMALLWRARREAFKEPDESGIGKHVAWFDANSRVVFSVLASLLLAALLYYTVEGNLLTIAWAIEGLGLLAAGFLAPERTLRLSGLALLGVCLFKVFLIDLEGVETIYRIFSFIVLGLILLSASFGYTKYRHVIKRYV